MTRFAAVVLSVVSLAATTAAAGKQEKAKPRLIAYIGNAIGHPDPNHKPWNSIEVAFGTHAAPPIGAVVTLVPQDASLPTVTALVAGSEPDPHDQDTAVHLAPVTTRAWLNWEPPAAQTIWYYPRVMILVGTVPRARAISIARSSPRDLPPRTRHGDVGLAIDADGDGRVDALVRSVCEDGGHACEVGCDEIWVRSGRRSWYREDRTCGD